MRRARLRLLLEHDVIHSNIFQRAYLSMDVFVVIRLMCPVIRGRMSSQQCLTQTLRR
jgi:hypothetical protein